MDKKILVIENQNFQYKEIIRHLGRNNIEYYPKPEKYIELIDHVRVWVNDGYDRNSYREKSLDYIYAALQEQNFDLILMDHILGGAYHCLTGIDLAGALNKKRKDNKEKCIPVVFLSKTENNLESRLKDYDKYEVDFPNSSEWIHKGYFGDELLNKTYFDERVIKGIDRVIEISKKSTNTKKKIDEKKGYVTFFEERVSYLQKANRNKEEKKEMDILQSKLLPILNDNEIPLIVKTQELLDKIMINISRNDPNANNYSELEYLLNK